VLSSLIGAMKTGRGGDVDVSLFDVALHQLTYPGNWYLNEGHRTERMPRSSHPSAVPVQLFRTGDGWIFVMCMTAKFWQALIEQIDRADLATDPRFATAAERRLNRDELTRVLDQEFARGTTRHWLDRLQGLLPAAPVYDLPQALDNPYAQSVGMVRPLPLASRPDFRVLANPIKLDGERLPARCAPQLGEHTGELLREVGYSEAEIQSLRDLGAA
jgi:crotonobetainyl-CoA:carnitine CoA-transferase CaiB-like acyl-CoA transferase